MKTVNIVCMKWGAAYSADYVNRLYSMVQHRLHRQFRFICFTDDANGLVKGIEIQPLPDIEVPQGYQQSPWRKLAIFKPGLADLSGTTLFLDLDLILVDDIDAFFEFANEDDFCIIENWTQLGQGIGNSSVYRFAPNQYSFIYEAYAQNPMQACKSCDNEQIFLSRQIISTGTRLRFWPTEWCRSFKRHALPKWPWCWIQEPLIPKGAKIMVFHGHPKPEEAAVGAWPGKFWRRFRPASWVYEYWK